MEFTAEAADKLLNDLSLVRVSQLDGTVEDKSGPYVEPMHLQVVCRELWDKLPAGTESVTDADITQSGDVNQALAGYYARKVANIASSVGVSERALRVWLGGALPHRSILPARTVARVSTGRPSTLRRDVPLALNVPPCVPAPGPPRLAAAPVQRTALCA